MSTKGKNNPIRKKHMKIVRTFVSKPKMLLCKSVTTVIDAVPTNTM